MGKIKETWAIPVYPAPRDTRSHHNSIGIQTRTLSRNNTISPVPMSPQHPQQPWMTKQFQIYEYEAGLRAQQQHGSYPGSRSPYAMQDGTDNWAYFPEDTGFQRQSFISQPTSVAFYPEMQEYERGLTHPREHVQETYYGQQQTTDYRPRHYSGYAATRDHIPAYHYGHQHSREHSRDYHVGHSATIDQSRRSQGDLDAAHRYAKTALILSIISISFGITAIIISLVLGFILT